MPNVKFVSIAEEIKNRIQKQEYSQYQKLPSEYDLSKEFNVSRLTIRKAIDLLVSKKVLIRDPGKGTYILIKDEKIESGKMGLQGFTEVAHATGKIAKTEVLSLSPVKNTTEETKKILNIKKESIIKLVRKRYLDNQPMTIEQIEIQEEYIKGYSQEDFRDSLFHILENQGINVAYSHQEVEAVLVDEKISTLLEVPVGFPLLKIISVTYTADAKPIFFDTSYYRADKYKVKSTLTRHY